AARREGDVLFVTLTGDRHVNKGPGRPVFTELMRAEMLAALGCVDWVGISNWPSAEGVLRLIRPAVYVKGEDYADESTNITRTMQHEWERVESLGGRVVYTDEITFSSSTLINRHNNVFESEFAAYQARLRAEEPWPALTTALERIVYKRVVLVGEAIIDD